MTKYSSARTTIRGGINRVAKDACSWSAMTSKTPKTNDDAALPSTKLCDGKTSWSHVGNEHFHGISFATHPSAVDVGSASLWYVLGILFIYTHRSQQAQAEKTKYSS